MESAARSEFDVAVVGAGPAGAVTAIDLARLGLRTVLIERAEPPRYKTCGGGLVHRARRLLPLDLDGTVEHECRVADFGFLGLEGRFEVRRPVPIVHMTMRSELDARLARAAVQAGAELRTGCEVHDFREQAGGVNLATSRGELRAGWVVAADGVNSRIARSAGWPANPRVGPALECEVHVDPASLERLSRGARFDFGLPERGYAWVFPKRDHLSIGVLSVRRGAVDLRGALERYIDLLPIERVESVERHGATIPLAPRPGGLTRGRVLLVGDAAGLADPISGEGIGPALESGRVAAAALAEGRLDPARVGHLYARRLGHSLLAELRIARLLARLLYGPPRLRDLLFALHGQRLAEAMTDVVVGERSYRQIVRSPKSWLRLLVPRHGPGTVRAARG